MMRMIASVKGGDGADGGGESGAMWEVVEVCEGMVKAVITETCCQI